MMSPYDPLLTEHADLLTSLRQPAIFLAKTKQQQFSKLGGLPLAPASFLWPIWQNQSLAFLCQLDLAVVTRVWPGSQLPPTGYLYFFYDANQRTWGFDPKDQGSWQVIYLGGDHKQFVQIQKPVDLHEDYIYNQKFITPKVVDTYPSADDLRIDQLDLTEEQLIKYDELCISAFADQPAHYMLGYPFPQQGNDMDLECQLASNGLFCGDSSGYNDPKAEALESGAKDWRLLLQLESDEDIGMMWGDMGTLYFWIKEQDLLQKHFDKTWMVLQCG